MFNKDTNDKYKKVSYDPMTGGQKRELIRYGDGV